MLLTAEGMFSFIIDSREKMSLDKKSLQILILNPDYYYYYIV